MTIFTVNCNKQSRQIRGASGKQVSWIQIWRRRAIIPTWCGNWKAWFAPATTDFKKTIERDGRYYLAWDRLGMAHEMTGELDQAICDYSQEMVLNPLGRTRLADAYCTRGNSDQKEKKYDAAIADYKKSIDTGATADGCSCDPYNPLLWLYAEGRRYDQGWGVVYKARKSGERIPPNSWINSRKNPDAATSLIPFTRAHRVYVQSFGLAHLQTNNSCIDVWSCGFGH
jgi:tetratricopeptide (TPR) repeat protein